MIASEPLDNIAASEPEKRIQASMVKLSWRLMKCLMIWACVSSLSLFVFEAFRSAAIMAALALLWAGCIVLFQRGHHRTARLSKLVSTSGGTVAPRSSTRAVTKGCSRTMFGNRACENPTCTPRRAHASIPRDEGLLLESRGGFRGDKQLRPASSSQLPSLSFTVKQRTDRHMGILTPFQ